jgi:hypothetical protein
MCIVISGVVRLLCAKDLTVNEIHKEMLPMYSEHCLSRQAVHNMQNVFRGKISDNVAIDRAVCAVRCARGSDSNHKNCTLQVPRDLGNGGTSV